METLSTVIRKHATVACFALVLFTSYFTYFFNYQNPQAFYWDENYHVASAQKYLNGVHFMEPHPPLGKLFIALGEVLLQSNATDDQFLTTDYAQNPPDGFSFTGYRFFPALFAWLAAPLMFWILLMIMRRPVWAMLLTSLYTFDTAQIVHGRGAMLETCLLFFTLVAVAGVVRLRHDHTKKDVVWAGILYGGGFALALATKVFALILVLLLPVAALLLWKKWRMLGVFAGVAAAAFLIPYVTVWQIHFGLGARIVPELPDQGYYQASEEYKHVLDAGATGNLRNFPLMLKDSIAFVGHYQRGVPRLDLCKSDENGSPWFLWPVGGRTINYRWATGGAGAYRYLSLVPNPAIWIIALLGVVLGGGFVLAEALRGGEELKERTLLLLFLGLYVGFLAAVSQITRVMYLYHYFLPLNFAVLLLGVVMVELRCIGKWKLTDHGKTWLLIALNVAVLAGFQFMRPLAYYEPLTDDQVLSRNVFKVWELRCARCQLESPLVERPGGVS